MTEDSLDVRHKSGQVVRISLDDRTEYYLNRKLESRQIVLRDTRVTVDVESVVGGNRARRIDVYR
jgi:frataxin-like iron-binding protein CyaY